MRPRIQRKTRWIGWVLFSISLAGAGGCGKTATVTGKVSYQGRPVTYGSLIFLSADRTARSGVIERDGSYRIEGVPPGTAKIGVISRDPSKGRSVVRNQKRADAGNKEAEKTALKEWFPLPSKFEDPAASGLSFTVDSRRVSHDIDLK
jgi:hypothetical protein